MMILPSFGSVRFRMSKMDVLDVSRENYHYVSNKYVRVIVTVYAGITILSFVSLLLAGMPLFDAANHALSVTATGGFSTRNASIAAFDSPLIEGILIFFMIVATLHFGLIYASFASRSFKVLRNPVTKFYLFTILLTGLAVTLDLYFSHTVDGFLQALREGFFEVTATISTTGFAIADTNGWPVFTTLILLFVAMQCGCSGSTTSGLRSDRVLILMQACRAQIVKFAHPNAVVHVRTGGTIIERDLLESVTTFTILYLFFTFIGGLIYSLFGFDLLESIGISIAMMSNVGPAFGSVGTMANFAAVPALAKVIMGIQMIIGRLGIVSVLMIIPTFNKRY